jgi:hypothetical protein
MPSDIIVGFSPLLDPGDPSKARRHGGGGFYCFVFDCCSSRQRCRFSVASRGWLTSWLKVFVAVGRRKSSNGSVETMVLPLSMSYRYIETVLHACYPSAMLKDRPGCSSETEETWR